MKRSIIFIAITLAILDCARNIFAGDVYYFDPEATSGSGEGTFENPFYTVAQVNAKSFQAGDDLYFKAGTTYMVPAGQKFRITWYGTADDKVIIGAYFGENQFGDGTPEGLQGNTRPIIDGNFAAPGNQSGLINNVGTVGHVTVQDIQVQNVEGYGIACGSPYNAQGIYSQGNKVLNCYTKNTTYQGIIFPRTSYGLVEGNTIEHPSYGRGPGSGLEITGVLGPYGTEGVHSIYNVVRNNRVFWGFEGIGVYKGAKYTLVENNIIHDCRSYLLYKANARNAIFRNNIVYENSDNQLMLGTGYDTPSNKLDRLICSDCEGHNPGVWKGTGELAVYNNVVAGGNVGIFLGNNCYEILGQHNNKIFNNTIVDCQSNFHTSKLYPTDTANSIRNNISWTISDDSKHSNIYSPASVTWDNNNFSSAVSGNASANAEIGIPGLSRVPARHLHC